MAAATDSHSGLHAHTASAAVQSADSYSVHSHDDSHFEEADGDADEGDPSLPASTSPSSRAKRTAKAAPSSSATSGARKLTASQLEKKRKNDREAQRAIRERTKKQIESLEQRIRDLESGEAVRQLNEALRRREQVEAENVLLREKIKAVWALLGPTVERFDLSRREEKVEGSSTNSSLVNSPRQAYPSTQSATSRLHHVVHPHAHARARSITAMTPETASPDPRPSHDININHKRRRTSYARTSPTSTPSSLPGIDYPHLPIPDRPPLYFGQSTRLPLNTTATCRLDTIIQDFTSESRRRIREGARVLDVLGPPYPVLDSLARFHPGIELHLANLLPAMSSTTSVPRVLPPINTDEDHYADYPLSELLIEVLKGFSAIKRLSEQVAVVGSMFATIRWMTAPSEETFAQLPDWAVPIEEQFHVAHPVWIDFIPWPQMRQKMLYNYPMLPLDDFFLPYSTSLSLTFPAANDPTAILYRDAAGRIRAQPAFDAYWRDINNWSLTEEFGKMLPVLQGTFVVRERDERGDGAGK